MRIWQSRSKMNFIYQISKTCLAFKLTPLPAVSQNPNLLDKSKSMSVMGNLSKPFTHTHNHEDHNLSYFPIITLTYNPYLCWNKVITNRNSTVKFFEFTSGMQFLFLWDISTMFDFNVTSSLLITKHRWKITT